MNGAVEVSRTGQVVGIAIGAALLVVGLVFMFNLGNSAFLLARWHDKTRGVVPAWIRQGPSTWSLDAEGFRYLGGAMAVIGVIFIAFVAGAIHATR
jgi:hypothetical protein